ncbi:MAG TPA: hypothetical protein VFQ68_10400 [Streptosporangiaceae bacterium]|nr:hypothetical protein [Streptosporangiaceae bacterium]
MIDRYAASTQRFLVHLIEDGPGEDDGDGWVALTARLGGGTETPEAMAICRRAGYRQFVSHRFGETEDHLIADLAVGTGCGHLKSGAPADPAAGRAWLGR